jgi:predicted amidohydrolase
MIMVVRFAVAQTKVTLNANVNLGSIVRMTKRAKIQGADLVLFPEYFISGPKPSKELSKEVGLIREVQKFASSSKIYIVGSHQELDDDKFYNTAFLISNNGEIIAKHRKICLMPEEIQDGFSAGKVTKVFKTLFGKLALPVCYDSFNKVIKNLSS